MRVIWDNPPYGQYVRCTAERVGKRNYRVEMTSSSRSCITYGTSFKRAFHNALTFQLNGFFLNHESKR